MHLVNLLPEELRVKKTKIELIITPETGKLFAAFLLVDIFIFGWWLFLRNEINKVKFEQSKIENSWSAAEPLVKERLQLLEQKEKNEETVSFLRQFLARDILWSRKLRQLSRLVPREIWFTEMLLCEEQTEKKSYGAEKLVFPKKFPPKDEAAKGGPKQISEIKKNKTLEIIANVSFLESDDSLLSKINYFIDSLKKDSAFFEDFESLIVLDLRKVEKAVEPSIMFKLNLHLKKE